ncbi:hypothetical protein ABE485_20810 [Achromobacter spanius]|uniref:hypothetical protein n=1 Tax=Achromobacter spanius TaxID=217203 RepID=UPI00320B0F42
MNTADFSVLPDELVVSLNPLRRGANRARDLCARLTGLAMPWNASSAGGASGSRVRSGKMPARWPFPPAPAPVDELARIPAAGVPVAAPIAAPVAAPVATPAAPAVRDQCLGDAKVQAAANQLTVKAMVIDVVLVLAWGAMIPGLMWLGVAGGF